jgi:hypothetical protein
MRFLGGRRRSSSHGPDDLEVVEMAAGSPGAALEMRERRLRDALVETYREEHAVGDLAGDLDRLRSRRRHQRQLLHGLDRAPRAPTRDA